MGSVSSASSGLTDLLQTLTQDASPEMSSVLSMPSVQSALENAPPADIVQLSTQALQLQAIGELFGDSAGSATPTTPDSLLAALESQLAPSGSTASGGSTAATGTNTATSAQEGLQAAEVQALFGADSASSSSDSLLNLIG